MLGPVPPSQVQEEHMPEAEDKRNKNSNSNSIGIIHPPPHIRMIVDKTACLVARWGPELEQRSIRIRAGDPFFSFFNGSDPYHAYYQHRLLEFQMQFLELDAPVVECTETDPKILDPAEAEEYKKWLPEGITGEELDLVKHYALSVARFGTAYVTRIRDKPRCPSLEKPSHGRVMFFNTLVAAYWKILMAPNALLEKAKASGLALKTMLERELHHLEWERFHMSPNDSSDDGIGRTLPGPAAPSERNTNNSEKEASTVG